jgi:hypothetical protein
MLTDIYALVDPFLCALTNINRELGDEPSEERRKLGEESPAWPETWSSGESLTTSLTRSDDSSVKILQYKYVER